MTRVLLRAVCWMVGHQTRLLMWPMGWLCTRCHMKHYWMRTET